MLACPSAAGVPFGELLSVVGGKMWRYGIAY
jgi:hypothetical protein